MKSACKGITIIAFAVFCIRATVADALVLNSGEVFEGTVLQIDDKSALIKLTYGTINVPRSNIKRIQTNAVPPNSAATFLTNRIPPWGTMVSALSKCEWAHSVKQIPATVIDKGILERVPYISFRCNAGMFQLNIYGDLDSPAAIEIGTFRTDDLSAKTNCIRLISSAMPSTNDKSTIAGLKLNTKCLETKDALSFETTMPDEPDAYGGWWVTVYDKKALERARVSTAELAALTVERDPAKASTSAPSRAQPIPLPVQVPTSNEGADWSPVDLNEARVSGGRVYVRGYSRKDGTYVPSHTRRR